MDFLKDVLLLSIGALIGLIIDFLRNQLGRERRQVTFSTSHMPIVATSGNLPHQVKARIPPGTPQNVVRFRVDNRNTGNQQIGSARLIIQPAGAAAFVDGTVEVKTSPAIGVKYKLESVAADGICISDVTLEPNETLEVTGYVVGDGQLPEVVVGWEGGSGGLQKIAASSTDRPRVEGHLRGILVNYVVAQIGPGIFGTVGYAATALVGLRGLDGAEAGVVGVAQVFGTLWRVYFLLRMIPHMSALLRLVRGGVMTS